MFSQLSHKLISQLPNYVRQVLKIWGISLTKMFKTLALLSLLGLAYAQIPAQDVTISLFATDLTGCDSTSACDAVVKVMCASASSDWRECKKTQEMKDDNFPVWPERFTFAYSPSERPRWRFDVIDQDVLFDDPIGSVTVSMEDFLIATETQTTMRFPLNGRGYFYVHRRVL